ncbi:Trp biosynthesis-associated membrane protein [Actinotalea sp. JY-7876]|uniref:Trp biosynthesis-associated membrane protein n=1 Tax=Actinotalea sp. JY-7876 TaxID=2758442 RepID=UPI0015F6F297|nr:Trp biosynthesis-associated membrane protein [Actinotalea sp. JY-7876]
MTDAVPRDQAGGPAPDENRAARPRSGRARTVWAALVLGAAALLAGTGVWVRGTTTSPVAGAVPVAAVGSVVAPGVNAGGLLVLAAAGALALGGRWGARLAGAGIALGGVLVAASAAGGLADPERAAGSAASAEVGVSALTGPVVVTPLPWVAVALGAALVLLGVVAVVRAGRWPARRSDRHEVPAPAPGEPSRPTTAQPAPERAADDLDAWDALSRGEDPT